MTVSVVLSVFNGEKFLAKAIESVLNQSVTDIEFIIINDGSTDSSEEILKQYAKLDNRIIVVNKKNSGLTNSLNVGLRLATGEYIARIDADDIWFQDKIKNQVEVLTKEKDCYLIGTAYNNIDGNGNVLSLQQTPFIVKYEEIKEYIYKFNPFLHSSVMFRKIVLTKVGFYNEKFLCTQDYELWVRIIANFNVQNLSEIMVSRRYTSDMISVKREKEQRLYAVKVKFLAIKLLGFNTAVFWGILKDIVVVLLPSQATKLLRLIKI